MTFRGLLHNVEHLDAIISSQPMLPSSYGVMDMLSLSRYENTHGFLILLQLIHLLDVSNQHICDQEVQILLVGYIRGLSNEVHNINKKLELLVSCRRF